MKRVCLTPHFIRRNAERAAVFEQAFNSRQTKAIGEGFTGAAAFVVAPDYTGPIDIVNGENDYFFCGGNCLFPTDQTVLVRPTFFPSANNGSSHFIVPGTGHNVGLHHGASEGYNHSIEFLKSNNIY